MKNISRKSWQWKLYCFFYEFNDLTVKDPKNILDYYRGQIASALLPIMLLCALFVYLFIGLFVTFIYFVTIPVRFAFGWIPKHGFLEGVFGIWKIDEDGLELPKFRRYKPLNTGYLCLGKLYPWQMIVIGYICYAGWYNFEKFDLINVVPQKFPKIPETIIWSYLIFISIFLLIAIIAVTRICAGLISETFQDIKKSLLKSVEIED